MFVTDRIFGPQAVRILASAATHVQLKTIFAGKLRRYHNVAWLRQLTYPPIILRNIRDVFLVAVGYLQSLWTLVKFRPDVVFTKGGFVCLPVGLAAATLHIPLVIHDSDAHPGLTNRILARWATQIATGATLDNYDYDPAKTLYTGIPLDSRYHPVTLDEQRQLKASLGLPDATWPLILVTGGGLGSVTVNTATVTIGQALVEQGIAVLHLTGTANFETVEKQAPRHASYITKAFIDRDMADAINAADIVVTRAGATTLAELAASKKPIIIIPNRKLVSGHQLKNAAALAKADAALVINEDQLLDNPAMLLRAIQLLLADEKRRSTMAETLYTLVKTDAAVVVAAMLVDAYAKKSHSREERGT